MMKFLLFLTWVLTRSSAESHSLHYLYTTLTSGTYFPEFTVVGLVDLQQVVYYDSNINKTIPKTEWMKKISADDPGYWERETNRMKSDQEILKQLLASVMENFNHRKGIHTMQRMYGCDLDDDGTTRGYDLYGYDGEDFLSFDVKTLTWTAANTKAVITKHKWEATEDKAKYVKKYLEKECIDWLKKYVSYGRETLERTVPPEALMFQKFSSSPELVCHATGFFPSGVIMFWGKDGEDLIEDVELRETLPNQDGSFQKRSTLKVSPEDLQKHEYTCVIIHSTLKEGLVLKGGKSGGVLFGFVVGAVVGVLTLVAIIAGILVCKKKKSGFKRVPGRDISREGSKRR